MTRLQGMRTWVFASAALMAIGAFGPWVKVLGVSVNGTDGGNDGWIVVVAAVLGGVIFARKHEQRAAGLALAAGAIAAVTCLYDRQNVSDAIAEAGAFGEALAQVGWGLNLSLVASISFAVAGAAWWRAAPFDVAETPPQPVTTAE